MDNYMGSRHSRCAKVPRGTQQNSHKCQVREFEFSNLLHVCLNDTFSWSRNSRYVMTSSRDWNCVLWDLETGERVKTIRFDCPASGASLHPRNRSVCCAPQISSTSRTHSESCCSKISVIVLASGQCIVFDMRWNRAQRSELIYTEANEASSWVGDDGPSQPRLWHALGRENRLNLYFL
jgi:WD40 repeat protein